MLYAGFDCSTQALSLVVIDAFRNRVVFRAAVQFDEPFIRSEDPAVVHADPLMWERALETLLASLATVPQTVLRAISGSAQQHGSVYCGEDPSTLTRASAPIWMDSSTWRECEEIEAAVGGPRRLAELTGSRAYPRFTGPQIRKFAREAPEAWAATRRVHLVSSYLTSLLIGDHAPIDRADASGMNLMDLRTREWSPAAVDVTAPDLASKLPPLTASDAIVGTLHPRWRERLGLRALPIVVCSGDNPCSLIGAGVTEPGRMAVSLGTSDTVFAAMSEPLVSETLDGHVCVSPAGGYFGMTVFRNGSLARERVRNTLGLTWRGFEEALRATPPGNDGALALPWFEPEITPAVPHPPATTALDALPPERQVRALIEAQMMAMANHSAWMGETPRVIHATGGASENSEILQVMADVFDAEVRRFASPESAALGAALRALQADKKTPWTELVERFVTPFAKRSIQPRPEYVARYRSLRARYAGLEASALAERRVT